MSQSAPDVVDASTEPARALDCFQSETHPRKEAQPTPERPHKPPHIAAPRRPKTQRSVRKRFEWAIFVSVFAGGLLVGALLTGPAFPTGSASATTTIETGAVRTAPRPPAIATNVVAVRNEQGTGGLDQVLAAGHDAGAERTGASSPEVVQRVASGYRGTLIVTSKPRGASVFVNGKLRGQTPLVLRGQSAGSRAVRLDLDGYAPWSRGVQVVADQSTTIDARLSIED